MNHRKSLFSLAKWHITMMMISAVVSCCCALHAEPADDALFRNGAIQRVADSYLSPLPVVPDIKTDFAEIYKVAKTGDVIIENNLAFPQY